MSSLLVADDSDIVRERIVELIGESTGISDIYEAVDTESAENIIKTKRPDFIILDIWMPGDGGIELLKHLKWDEQYNPTIIMLTNYPYPHYRLMCKKEGVKYFFDKATDFEKIPKIINSEIEGA
jgi:DNA-binding NarL/FixJ family response regulator